MQNRYEGVMFVGDVHLSSRSPGYRKDDYPREILTKLSWCLELAEQQNLLIAFLGDIFHFPRDNANWLMVELLRLFRRPALAIYGNHDVAWTGELTGDDSLSILIEAGCLRLVSQDQPWRGTVAGKTVTIGGSSYGQRIPRRIEESGYVIWLTHHDIRFAGYEEARFGPFAAPGIDLVVNGHIHRPLPSAQAGSTLWLNPGSIARVSRSEASRRRPSATVFTFGCSDQPQIELIEIPHRPFEDVFHAEEESLSVEFGESQFIHGLRELERFRTGDGGGLISFLELNRKLIPDPQVFEQIRRLAEEVIADVQSPKDN